ncbi:glyoxal reductase-like [Bacillus rossius redtenbacheri]|uniref:glyoxal reductase-like n=1 Tax=Bacillus rossius redtenbacheri TaxID=93214 RepID=UPI002FDD86F1
MSVSNSVLKLNNGISMPVIGLGTYKIYGTSVIFSVIEAGLKCGYRSIDTAAVYGNEGDIGEALKILLPKYGLRREDIFLTSKLGPADHDPSRVRAAVAASLDRLGTSYLDLYLVHWPGVARRPADSPDNPRVRAATWAELAALSAEGTLRSVGVSNYTARHLRQLLAAGTGVCPAVNQVEFHPRYRQRELAGFCREHGIALQAYCSLGGASSAGALLRDGTVVSVAARLRRSPAQVLLRWAVDHGVGIIPKSVNPERIAENIDLDFVIPEDLMEILDSISVVEKYSWDPEAVS